MNSTNGGPKYAEKILVKNSKKQLEFATCWELLTLHLHCVYSYSHRIYIVRYQKYSACMCIQSDFWGVQLFVTPWTVACQTPLSIGFSRQEYWRGLPCAPSGDLPNPGIQPPSSVATAMQVASSLLSHRGSPRNTEMAQSIQEDVHRSHADTIPFYIKDLSIPIFGGLWRSWKQ